MQHFLLTIPINGGYMHSYAMSDDPQSIGRVRSSLLYQAEEIGLTAFPLMLETLLDTDGTDQVRAFLRKRFPQIARTMKKATNFHCSMWSTPDSGPDVDWLLKLH